MPNFICPQCHTENLITQDDWVVKKYDFKWLKIRCPFCWNVSETMVPEIKPKLIPD